jgi:hypothetical protein
VYVTLAKCTIVRLAVLSFALIGLSIS